MTPKLPVWEGSSDLTQCPDSPLTENDGDTDSLTVCYEGPHLVCLNAKPLKGQQLSEYPDAWVERSRVEKLRGAKGRLTIYLFKPGISVEQPQGIQADVPFYEIDWVQLDRPIEMHPMFDADFGKYALTAEDYVHVQKWVDETDQTVRANYGFHPVEDDSVVTLSENATVLAKKKLRGLESYLEFTPVYRVTTKCLFKPLPSACGFIEAPPGIEGTDYPEGYNWLKTAERAIRSGKRGKYELFREWTGCTIWDGDIYDDFSDATPAV